MRFCVDECSFRLPEEQSAQLSRLAEQFVELAQKCRDTLSENIGMWSNIYSVEVLPGITLADLLFELDYEHMLDPVLRKALIEKLRRCVLWDKDHAIPEPASVEVEGTLLEAPTIAFAHVQASEKKAVAALGLCSSDRCGRKEVKRNGESRPVHFVTRSKERLEYLRDVPEIEDMSAQQYMAHTPLAFPTLRFADGLANQFNRFSQSYRDIRPKLTRHLSALEDHFQSIHQAHRGDTHRVMAEFRARCSIDASPEGPNTHRNKAAMDMRRVDIDGKRVLCEWHTKIEPDRDRIHFSPGTPEVADGCIVIGIFHKHLPT